MQSFGMEPVYRYVEIHKRNHDETVCTESPSENTTRRFERLIKLDLGSRHFAEVNVVLA